MHKNKKTATMIKRTLSILIILTGSKSYGQNDSNQFIGVNIFQLPTSTINFNYSIDYKPFLTPFIDIGYTFGYNENYDLDIKLFTPQRYKDGYTSEKQSGGYLKTGGYINLRKDFEKQNFFHLGLFLTNSIVYEKGLYHSLVDSRPMSYAEKMEHTVYFFGFSTALGYEFKITNRLKTHIDLQLSIPANKYLDLYGYNDFISGMGLGDTESRVFSMIIVNLKYRL